MITNQDYLKNLVRELTKLPYETEWVEFKVNNIEPQMIGEYISALSNSATLFGRTKGYLIWGIEDKKHEIVGTDFDYRNAKKGNGKVLVVYYSQTGTTEGVAKIIARETNADLVKLEVKNEYTSDDLNWTDKNSRVNREHDNPNSRNVELKNAVIPDFSSYDTVFIGYPIWWREASWVLDDFVKKNDFTGKTVIPFGTSMSTGDGTSGNRLKKLTKTGNWIAGQRFSSSYNESEVVDWVKSLKY